MPFAAGSWSSKMLWLSETSLAEWVEGEVVVVEGEDEHVVGESEGDGDAEDEDDVGAEMVLTEWPAIVGDEDEEVGKKGGRGKG